MPLQTGFEDIVQAQVPLSERIWFKLGGAAEYFAEPTTVDQIAERSEVAVHRVLSTISVLEMRHLVRRVGGDRVTRAHSGLFP